MESCSVTVVAKGSLRSSAHAAIILMQLTVSLQTNSHAWCQRQMEVFTLITCTHAYYYQVQTQLFVCNVDYCDICVCTFSTRAETASLHVERISSDFDFWSSCVDASTHFFTFCLLPELLGKWYTKLLVPKNGDNSTRCIE